MAVERTPLISSCGRARTEGDCGRIRSLTGEEAAHPSYPSAKPRMSFGGPALIPFAQTDGRYRNQGNPSLSEFPIEVRSMMRNEHQLGYNAVSAS